MSDQQRDSTNLLMVEIGNQDAARQAYPVRATLGDGSAATDWLQLADLPPPPPPQARSEDLAAYGVALFGHLFSGALLSLFQQAWIGTLRGNDLLHFQLWIKSDAAELQGIPWEVLHMPNGQGEPIPLAATPQVAFSRYVDSAAPFGQPIERWPLRILVAISAPHDIEQTWPDLTPIVYADERARLARVLSAVSNSGQIEYRFLDRTTPENLVRSMEAGYQIVIFYGHGLYAPRLGTSLMMERPDGSTRLYAARDLVEALRRSVNRPALFILISCNTASQRANPALDNLAIQIVRDGSVPAVVAMRDLVEVALARSFTQYLCDYLLRYGVIDRAVTAARRQVINPNQAGWSTPVLYMRSRDGRLFVPNAQLEFARLLSNDPQIMPTALAAPSGARLDLLRGRPDDQPNPREARALLNELLAPTNRPASPAPMVVSGGSRISRSLLLQQWGWQQNRREAVGDTLADASATAPLAIYLSLADDRQFQTGARIEDLLIDAASTIDPAYGMALMKALAADEGRGADRFILLIDGLEAIDSEQRPRLASTLDSLARRKPAPRILISVEEDMAPPVLQGADIVWLMLCPLSERQIRAYLKYRDPTRSMQHMEAIIQGGLRDLAGDPQLLTLISEQLIDGQPGSRLTRDDLLNGLLDRLIDRAAGNGVARTTVRGCIYTLAWELHWNHRRSLGLSEAQQIIQRALGESEQTPEAIYRAFVGAGTLVEVGGGNIQFSHLEIQAYAAARGLHHHNDRVGCLEEIMVQACFPEWLAWWSPVLIGLAQRAESLSYLAPVWAPLGSEVSGSQAVLATRCIGSFLRRNGLTRPRKPEDEAQIAELLDRLIIQIDPRFEPNPTSRALMAEALGQLPYPKVRAALRRQLGEQVLLVNNFWQFDRPIVRMAAARALRDMRSSSKDSQPLDPILQAWQQNQTTLLLSTLRDQSYAPAERTLATFALSDLSDRPGVQEQLLTRLFQPEGEMPKKEWQATQAAIADALLLEADADLARLLTRHLENQAKPEPRTQLLLIGIVGACATYQPALLKWLYAHLDGEPTTQDANSARSESAAATSDTAPNQVMKGIAQVALARALACNPTLDLPLPAAELAQKLESLARTIIEEPISSGGSVVTTLRRLAIETLVWLGATGDGTPPQAINSWPVALRQAWWESVSR
ncbi:MAG: CHAT domain-containing protein [Oscillochloris sp.]|nr:CHAT domain-containing protein [Oscillochloris sp.]